MQSTSGQLLVLMLELFQILAAKVRLSTSYLALPRKLQFSPNIIKSQGLSSLAKTSTKENRGKLPHEEEISTMKGNGSRGLLLTDIFNLKHHFHIYLLGNILDTKQWEKEIRIAQ